jgi:hypothetical protein
LFILFLFKKLKYSSKLNEKLNTYFGSDADEAYSPSIIESSSSDDDVMPRKRSPKKSKTSLIREQSNTDFGDCASVVTQTGTPKLGTN